MSDISANTKKKNTAVNRYGLMVILFSVVFVVIFVFIIRLKYVDGEMWRKRGEALLNPKLKMRDREIPPNRGDIFSWDGRLLATSEPRYGIYVDFMADGIEKDTLMKYVGPLSTILAKKYPDRTAAQYRSIFVNNWLLSRKELAAVERNKGLDKPLKMKIKSRYVRIIRPDIYYLDLKELLTYPFFNQRSNKSGLITEEKTERARPFGPLAGRTIGSIYEDISRGGYSGVELKCDSVLKGVPGLKSKQRIQGRWIDVTQIPAQNGLDVKTTLDVDIQDITERALRQKLIETEAESGCAVIMEVKTGEIKAISNLDRTSKGTYVEGNPNTFSYMSEPGSTFKTASIMVALEDGIVTPRDSFFVGNGIFQYKGKQVKDWYWRTYANKEFLKKGKNYLTVKQGIELSSNIVISKTILKGYENNPERYVQKLYDLGITRKIDWDVPLRGIEGRCIIRRPNDKSNPWSKTTLAWMSFGYETQVPPIYLLMFYNGIANNGKMIKPFVIKEYLKNGEVVKEFATDVINPKLCSDKTLSEIKDMLVSVVKEGVGKPAGSESFQSAGKTGTAMIADGKGGYSGYYVSFCGFFPAGDPQYTCFVGIRKPHGDAAGGIMAGAVFKNISEEVYSHNVKLAPQAAPRDSFVISKTPETKGGFIKNIRSVLAALSVNFTPPPNDADWVNASIVNGQLELKKNAIIKGLVPNVLGMGARDAVYLMENAGLRIVLNGSGKVVSQSIPENTKVIKGATVTLQLN